MLVFWWLALALTNTHVCAQSELSLELAIKLAQRHDPWQRGSHLRERASVAESVAVGRLPDPVIVLGLNNFPVDTFDVEQEAMTQVSLGVTQVLPRGKSRRLKRRQQQELAAQQPLLRADRRARIEVTVALLWLDAYFARESIRIIENDRALFEGLVDITQSSYASASGKTRQQDLVRAQLELTRLDDRLIALRQHLYENMAQLGEWVRADADVGSHVAIDGTFTLSTKLTEPALHFAPDALQDPAAFDRLVNRSLRQHPAVQGVEQEARAQRTAIEVAKQSYRPQWGISARYGYRGEDQSGRDRADFLSLGLSIDMPLFTATRQDKRVEVAIARAEAVKTERALVLRRLKSRAEAARARLLRLQQRRALYRGRLLVEIRQQAEAALTAYINADGDFAEVARARIAEVNAHIDALGINIDRLKVIAQLNYFFAASSALNNSPTNTSPTNSDASTSGDRS